MLPIPSGIAHGHLHDLLVVFSLDIHRNGEPDRPLGCLDPVPIPPVPPRILNMIKQYKCIHVIYQIEVPFPGDVVRLYYCSSAGH